MARVTFEKVRDQLAKALGKTLVGSKDQITPETRVANNVLIKALFLDWAEVEYGVDLSDHTNRLSTLQDAVDRLNELLASYEEREKTQPKNEGENRIVERQGRKLRRAQGAIYVAETPVPDFKCLKCSKYSVVGRYRLLPGSKFEGGLYCLSCNWKDEYRDYIRPNYHVTLPPPVKEAKQAGKPNIVRPDEEEVLESSIGYGAWSGGPKLTVLDTRTGTVYDSKYPVTVSRKGNLIIYRSGTQVAYIPVEHARIDKTSR